MESALPGMESGAPGMESGLPGMESSAAGMESGAPGMECRAAGMECGAAGMESGQAGGRTLMCDSLAVPPQGSAGRVGLTALPCPKRQSSGTKVGLPAGLNSPHLQLEMHHLMCNNCHYDLRGVPETEPGTGRRMCPECGVCFAPALARAPRSWPLRWKVPVLFGAAAVLLTIGVGVLALAAPYSTGGFMTNAVLVPLAGLLNWLVTSAVWIQTVPRSYSDCRLGIVIRATLVGFLAGITTAAAVGVVAVAVLSRFLGEIIPY